MLKDMVFGKECVLINNTTNYYVTIYGNIYFDTGMKGIHRYKKILGYVSIHGTLQLEYKTIDNKVVKTAIHILVADAFIPNPDKLINVKHLNGNKLDNSLFNLKRGGGSKYCNGYKICAQCEKKIIISKFSKNSHETDKYNSKCKECLLKNNRSELGLLKTIYLTQKKSSQIREHPPPGYKLEEFIIWVSNQSNFKSLYKAWVKSKYDKELTPSVDRKDHKLYYTFDNIQLVTWGYNRNKGYLERKKGYKYLHSKVVS